MIDKEQVERLVQEKIEGTDLYLVEVLVRSGNSIQVLVDSPEGISIDTCVDISRFLNGRIDREEEDYSLEVSSPGIGSPFRVRQQYDKNIGRDIEVVLLSGQKKKGSLLRVNDEGIEIETIEKVAEEAVSKKKKTTTVKLFIGFNEIKVTKEVISFK